MNSNQGNEHIMKASASRQGPRPIRSEPAAYLYAVGQEVRLKAGSNRWVQTAGLYHVTRILPLSGSLPQYRIRSADEAHERVATQDQLEAAEDASEGAALIARTFGKHQGTKT